MTAVRSIFRWLFAPPTLPGAVRSIGWWEARRIPVNLLVAAYGVVCLLIFFWAITSAGVLQPGEDAVEPLAILAAPILFNVAYTLGWMVEAPARAAVPNLSPKFGPRLLMLGLAFSFCVISLPALFWGAYRCLQIVRLIK
jgi:hypothetical protein